MFSARSRHGASHVLAQVLGAAGVSDQPLIIREAGLRSHLAVCSPQAWAGRMMSEGARNSVLRPTRLLVKISRGGSRPIPGLAEFPSTAPCLHCRSCRA